MIRQQPIKMQLKPLLSGFAEVDTADDREILDITADSRQAGAGSLFVAIPGIESDGRQYIEQAISAGASAIAYDDNDYVAASNLDVPAYAISDLNHKQGAIASRFYAHPSRHLLVIGITGTNGKSTCVHLLAQALGLLGKRSGILGTVGNGFPGRLSDSALTTLDVIGNQGQMAQFSSQGAAAVCMEVSSHGLAQDRVAAIEFDVAVFTNLTQDHLDYHGSMADYAAAKRKLFSWPGLSHRVINIDDAVGRELAQVADESICWTYGLQAGDVYAEQISITAAGIELRINWHGTVFNVESPLIGRINVANLLAVITTLLALGEQPQQIATCFRQLQAPPGRMELFNGQTDQADLVVDYAHTPDALKRALQSLREHCRNQLVVVFGCGGERDRSKREQMGLIAEAYADRVIVTDDNPRGESPEQITAEIIRSMKQTPPVIHDRRQAIETAFSFAEPGDMILVAGKGHETTQTIGSQKLAFDDRKLAAELTGVTL